MIIVCCSDKLVITCVHQIPNSFNLCGNPINIFFRAYARLLGKLLYFLSVFVRSRTEEHIVSHISFKSRYCVCQNNLICVSYMRLTRCICDCGCNIKLLFIVFIHYTQFLSTLFCLLSAVGIRNAKMLISKRCNNSSARRSA